MKLNLKDWKKVSTQSDHTILKNKHGHELKLAHKALPQHMQDQLHELEHHPDSDSKKPKFAQGGTVASNDNVPEPNKDNAAAMSKGATESKPEGFSYWENLKNGLQGKAHGGVVNKYAHGGRVMLNGEDGPQTAGDAQDANQPAAPAPVVINVGGGQSPQQPIPSPQQPIPSPQQAPQAAPSPEATPGIDKASQDLQSMGKPGVQSPQPEPQSPEQQANSQPVTAQEAQAMQPQQNPFDPGELAMKQANAEQGVQQALAAGDKNQAAALQTGINQSAMTPQQKGLYDHINQGLQQEWDDKEKNYQEYQKALQTPVDPNKYLNTLKADTGRHISTVIGLIFGGLGQGLAGGSNPALDMLNSAIDRDVQAQKNVLGNKETLYSSALGKYNNDQMAVTDAKHQMMFNAVKQMETEALKSGSQAKMQQAEVAKAQILSQAIPQMRQQQMMKTLQEVQQGGGDTNQALAVLSSMPGMEQTAKDLRERQLPAFGIQTTRAVPNDVANDLASKQSALKLTDDYMKFIQSNTIGGRLDPAKRAEGQALRTELENSYHKSQGLSSSAESMNEIGKLIDDPNNLTASVSAINKVRQIRNAITNQIGNNIDAYGPNKKYQAPPEPGTQGKQSTIDAMKKSGVKLDPSKLNPAALALAKKHGLV